MLSLLFRYEELCNFIEVVSSVGVEHFTIHARKCLLEGLSPEQNRKIPPLKYELVDRLCEDFPHLSFYLNGGIQSVEHALELLKGKGTKLV